MANFAIRLLREPTYIKTYNPDVIDYTTTNELKKAMRMNKDDASKACENLNRIHKLDVYKFQT